MHSHHVDRYLFSGNIHWFPGHMVKARKEMQKRLSFMDTIIEVRDARIPFTSGNPDLEAMIANKRRIIVFNKEDLADPKSKKKVSEYFKQKNCNVLFTSGNRVSSIGSLIRCLLQGPPNNVQRTRPENSSTPPNPSMARCILVVGMPNVGKSSIINSIRLSLGRSQPAKVGPLPGVTRSLSGFKISESPSAFLLDTPGIMLPKIDKKHNERGLKLVLTGRGTFAFLSFKYYNNNKL